MIKASRLRKKGENEGKAGKEVSQVGQVRQ